MFTHSVETDGRGGFQVRVTSPDEGDDLIVAAFMTRRDAREWIDNDTRLRVEAVARKTSAL
jgi:hypothetical protein